jgi:AcrR family transcriptional regulator
MRADARRNRETIVAVARELFATKGLAVSIDEVALHANVGVGTLYRHFPNKNALFEAVVLDRLEASIGAAIAMTDDGDPGKAFFDYLADLIDQAMKRKDLLDTLTANNIDIHSLTSSASERLRAAIRKLLLRAQHAGAVRVDVGIAEVMILLGSACISLSSQNSGDAQRRKIWRVLSDGLRSGPRTRRPTKPA